MKAERKITQPEPEIAQELEKMSYEPLLPVEKKLIGWSLTAGLILLIVLIIASRMLFPL